LMGRRALLILRLPCQRLIHLLLQGLLGLLGLGLLFGLLLQSQRFGLITGLILAGAIIALLVLRFRLPILGRLVGWLAAALLGLLVLRLWFIRLVILALRAG